jgi:DNA polymerase-3 subunit gamma/tau
VTKSSHYISLFRKYRPKLLADVFGQEVLAKILNYSIQKNQLASSLLLTGIRGIGKTTSARIIAQTINCSDQKISKGLVCSCQECANCQAFNSGAHPDIVEIDAASYTSVDNIRDVIEKAMYVPLLGRYKVFIIDEVHMLSKSAFNALLKTLEEPPAYVIFILLTTDLGKVPTTILSRCQKFNLKRLNVNELVALLEHVCQSELIDYEKLALENIAYKADGSARDALVMLEQTSFLAKQQNIKLTAEVTCENLDLNTYKYAIDFLNLILRQDAPNAIKLIDELYKNNFDFIDIIQAKIELIAFLSKAKLIPSYEWGRYNLYHQDVQTILESADLAFLTSLWQILNKEIQQITSSLNQLCSFEMLVIKAIYCSIIPSAQEVTQELKLGNTQGQIKEEIIPQVEPDKKKVPSCVKSSKLHQSDPNNNFKSSDSDLSIHREPGNKQVSILNDKLKESYLRAAYSGQEQEISNISNTSSQAASLDHQNNSSDLINDIKIEYTLVGNFLKYIHQNHMFDLYNFVMYKCEIINFTPYVLKVNVDKISSQIKDQIDLVLNNFMPGSWQVSYATTSQIESLQNKLKSKAKQDSNMKLIISFFPGAELCDVFFNFVIK